MGVLKSVGNFLFGKDPDIFDDQGNVVHKLPKKKWDLWADRMKTSPDYNWRNHTGTSAGVLQKPKSSQKNN
jgi:hypothetical protein